VLSLLDDDDRMQLAVAEVCLLVEEGISLRKNGVSEAMKEAALKKTAKNKKPVLPGELEVMKLDDRFRTIARVMQSNEMLLKDFLTGTNHDLLLRNSRRALYDKVEYAKRNARRAAMNAAKQAELAWLNAQPAPVQNKGPEEEGDGQGGVRGR